MFSPYPLRPLAIPPLPIPPLPPPRPAQSSPSRATPKYRRHATGQAFVYLNKHSIYLGLYGSPESHAKYRQTVAAWLNSGGFLPKAPGDDGITVAEFGARYIAFLRGRSGRSTFSGAKNVTDMLVKHYAWLNVDQLRPPVVRDLHRKLIEKGNCLATIRDRMVRLRMMLRWAVGEELILPVVLDRVRAVTLPTEHEGVRVTQDRAPVADKVVAATLPHLTPVLKDMILVQRLSGCRPGEVCRLRWADIDQSDPTKTGEWLYSPKKHKTQRKGTIRTIGLGPECRTILEKYRHRDPAVPIFSPRESERQRLDVQRARRKSAPTPSQRQRSAEAAQRALTRPRHPREGFTADTYNRALQNVLTKRDLPAWTPHQLRHARGHELVGLLGIHAVQAALGHSDLRMAQHYAHAHESRPLLAQTTQTEGRAMLRLRAV